MLNELKWDTRVEPTNVDLEVDNGIVTLTGTVSSFAKKVAAEEAAHRVSCVLDVANDVKVKVPGSTERTDSDIAAAVRHTLQWDVFVPDEQIQSTVANGIVTLKGHVKFASQRDEAVRAATATQGVVSVTDQMRIG